LPSFAANEPDSQRIILFTSAVSEREQTNHPSPQSSPRKRGEAQYCTQASVLSRCAGIDFDSITCGIKTLNRAFSAALMNDRIPGALPQAKAHIAPLALNTSVTIYATRFGDSGQNIPGSLPDEIW
jgi:hypothetical protein